MLESGNQSKEKKFDSTVPEVKAGGGNNGELNSSFVTPKKSTNVENLDTAETLAHLKETLRNGRYGRFSSSKEGDIFSHNPTRFTPKPSSPTKQKRNLQSNSSRRGHSISMAKLPSRYGSSLSMHGPMKSSLLSNNKYNYPSYGRLTTNFPSDNNRESINVSLYKYLDDNRASNPSNPLNYRDRYGGSYSGYGTYNRSSSVKGFSKDFKNQLKDKGKLYSPMEYTFNSYGKVSRSIAAPQQYKIGDRGQTYQNLIFRFPELEKKGFKVDKVDKELSINKDLLKTGEGYLDVCKGLLDSIRAVKVGDLRFAQNLMTNNKVVLGQSSAKKGKEFLKREHGIDVDNYQPSTERFRLTESKPILRQEKVVADEPEIKSFVPVEDENIQDDSSVGEIDHKVTITQSEIITTNKNEDEPITSHANYDIESMVSSGLPSAKGKKYGGIALQVINLEDINLSTITKN